MREPFLKAADRSLLPPLIILENGTGQWLIDLPGLLARHGYRERARTRLNLVFERPAENGPAAGDPA